MTNPHSQLSPQLAPLSTGKAQRQTIQLGTIPIQVFLLPDGSYYLSQTEVSVVIGKAKYSIRDFLNSKGFKALLGIEPASGILVEPVAVEGYSNVVSINPLTFQVVSMYWYHWSQKRNELAQALCQALMTYSLHQLADDAFGFKRTTEERQQQLANDLAQPWLLGKLPTSFNCVLRWMGGIGLWPTLKLLISHLSGRLIPLPSWFQSGQKTLLINC